MASSMQTITHLDLPPFFSIGQQTHQELIDWDTRSCINGRLNILASRNPKMTGKWKQKINSDSGYHKHSVSVHRPQLFSTQEHRESSLAVSSNHHRIIDGSTIEAQSDSGIFLDNGRGFVSTHTFGQAMVSSDHSVPRRSNLLKQSQLAPSRYENRRRRSRMVLDGLAEIPSSEVERARIIGARPIRLTPLQLPKIVIPHNPPLVESQESAESESELPRYQEVSSSSPDPDHQLPTKAGTLLRDNLDSLSTPAPLSSSTAEPETSSRPLHTLSRINLDAFNLLKSVRGLISNPKSTVENYTFFSSSTSSTPDVSPTSKSPVEGKTAIQSPPQILQQTCGVCGDESTVLSTQPAPTQNCAHDATTCQECLRAWIKAQLDSEGCEGISCPDCPQMLSHAEVQSSADPKDFER
jgi:hypothetical protein